MATNVVGIDRLNQGAPGWTIRIDGPEIAQLERRYVGAGRILPKEWEGVVATAAQILARCPKIDTTPGNRTGLALGKIQSGKTLSYTALIALAVDNGYRLVVVLGGTKRLLLSQTYSRLVYDLDARRQALTPFKNPNAHDGAVIDSLLHTGGNCLLVIQKNPTRIAHVRALLANPSLRSHPCLIIDDEGDEASLNNLFRQGRRSPTYSSILALRSQLPLHAYLAYTATPQANLLISGLDALSPDFAQLVEPGAEYCGGRTFFGASRRLYLRNVTPDARSNTAPNRITRDVELATACFLVGAAIRTLRGDTATHAMLLHTSNLQLDHERLERNMQRLITTWKDVIGLPPADPSRQGLDQLVGLAYQDLAQTVQNPPDLSDIQERLADELWQTETWMVNSMPLGRDPMETPFRLKNNILVGGNMLGRGLTIDGLAVSYITREASGETNADTLEQRARWFGYKAAYLDVCRIFLTPGLQRRYAELLEHEDDFWEALARNQRQGIGVADWPRMFRLDTVTWQLRPTRPQVANFRQFRGHGWEIQRHPSLEPRVARSNVQVADTFRSRLKLAAFPVGNVTHQIASDVDVATVITGLLSHIDAENTDWENSYMIEYLSRLQLGGILQGLDVVVMSQGNFRERTVENDGTISPMQGRSPTRSPNDPQYYPGDDAIHQNRVQLQLHKVRLLGAAPAQAQFTTALAIHIPDDPRFDLRMIVRGPDHP